MKFIFAFFPITYFFLMEVCTANPTSVTERESFNEEMYLFANPNVAELVKQGKYKSGLDHYTQVGQTTKKPDGESYETFFTGTAGNDTIRGFGKGSHTHLAGVEFELDSSSQKPFPLRFKNNGTGEIDILIGTTEGGNEFILGSVITSINTNSQPFYVGQGNKDYAKVQNFSKSRDSLILAGKPDQYKWESTEGNIQIFTKDGDLIAIIEGVDKLEIGEEMEEIGVFILK